MNNKINAVNNDGKTALMFAKEVKNKYIADYLLKHGAESKITV